MLFFWLIVSIDLSLNLLIIFSACFIFLLTLPVNFSIQLIFPPALWFLFITFFLTPMRIFIVVFFQLFYCLIRSNFCRVALFLCLPHIAWFFDWCLSRCLVLSLLLGRRFPKEWQFGRNTTPIVSNSREKLRALGFFFIFPLCAEPLSGKMHSICQSKSPFPFSSKMLASTGPTGAIRLEK